LPARGAIFAGHGNIDGGDDPEYVTAMAGAAKSLVFTGHMIDRPNRATPRFPPRLEKAAAAAIEAKIEAAMVPGMVGLASGARGGDILFHEIARALGLGTIVVLPFAPKIFEKTSVAGVRSGAWVARFRRLWSATPEANRLVMGLPNKSAAFTACNTKLIDLAAARGPFRLIALWNGEESGKPGGTDDMIRQAKASGAEVDIIHLSPPGRRGERSERSSPKAMGG
jgi:hypothetical protein